MIYNVLKDNREGMQEDNEALFDCSALPESKKYKFIADEIIQKGLSLSTYSNYIFEYDEIINKYKLENDDLNNVYGYLLADVDNIVDIERDTNEFDIIFNYTRCVNHEQSMSEEQQSKWEIVQKLFNENVEELKNGVLYNSSCHMMINTTTKSQVFEENVYSLAQARKVLNDSIYNKIEYQIEELKGLLNANNESFDIPEEQQQTM